MITEKFHVDIVVVAGTIRISLAMLNIIYAIVYVHLVDNALIDNTLIG